MQSESFARARTTKICDFWLDSNQRPTDYESREPSAFYDSNPKNSKEFPFPELPISAVTDPFPNRITLCLPTEPFNLKILKRFLPTELRTKTDPPQEIHEACDLE